jgi:DNA-binding winged helix-turn-helix (wHTH) protein
LIEHVWNGRAVSDAALNSRINAARRAIGDSGERQAIIRTVQRRGFLLAAEVRTGASGAAATLARAFFGEVDPAHRQKCGTTKKS